MNNEVKNIISLLTEVYDGNNWSGINAVQALSDIPVEKAVKKINADHLNIAELTAHLSCWNNVMVKRLNGENYQPAKEQDFPSIKQLTEEEWEKIKQDFVDSFTQLKEKLQSIEDAVLEKPMFEGATAAYRNLHGQISHLHYHIGQIVLLKKIL